MSYFLSPALVRLRSEINSLWPGRDKASDGWIGDAAHNARKSDHNPDYAAGGIVRAIDVDKDGIPADSVVEQIRRDQRTAYVIWNGRIWENPSAYPGRGYWRTYTGTNAHRQHFHVSVRHGTRWDRDDSSWGIVRATSGGLPIGGSLPNPNLTPVTPIEEDDMFDDADRKLLAETLALLKEQQKRTADPRHGVPQAVASAVWGHVAVPGGAYKQAATPLAILADAGTHARAAAAASSGVAKGGAQDAAAIADAVVEALGTDLGAQVADALAERLRGA